ncbi:lytic transglycosylase domain-containing protein [Brucella pituitosa]|uniref:lytic transglycosylase domain-containing protein n=1 Tax=Brucella pituitosa TaxID=571256 RepID=UPI0013747CC9|nr:lytic transglycosylase domain-containing protein [Brucella pituitosa]
MSRHIFNFLLAAAACLTMSSPAEAFLGRKVFDVERLIEEKTKLDQFLIDLKTQYHRTDTQQTILDTDDRIISELDKLITAGALPERTGNPTFDSLEKSLDEPKAAATNLYNPDDRDPTAKTFGDTPVTVEQIIIQGSQQTYSLAGVSQANLSQVQWRALMQALIWQESRFNPFIESKVGAFGLTQLMPDTAKLVGVFPQYKTDPTAQVRGGGTYLARMLAMFDGNIIHALAGYNAGPGRVQQYHGVPPFPETQNYVVVVPRKYNEYLSKIGGNDALGTLEPSLAADASYALASNTLRHYGNNKTRSVSLIAKRLKDILQQMKANQNPTKAWVLNTYARAEMVRVVALRARLMAVRTVQVGADALQNATDRAEERQFFNFTGQVQ